MNFNKRTYTLLFFGDFVLGGQETAKVARLYRRTLERRRKRQGLSKANYRSPCKPSIRRHSSAMTIPLYISISAAAKIQSKFTLNDTKETIENNIKGVRTLTSPLHRIITACSSAVLFLLFYLICR